MKETGNQIAKRLGISRAALYHRFKAGWKETDAMSTPKAKPGRKKGGKNKPKVDA